MPETDISAANFSSERPKTLNPECTPARSGKHAFMKIRILNKQVAVRPTQVAITQRCASHWNEAVAWQRAQKPYRDIHENRPLNSLAGALKAHPHVH